MSEHPLMLNGDMVRAVLAGSKTQFRVPVKPNPEHWHTPIICEEYNPIRLVRGEEVPGPAVFGFASEDEGWKCPFGKPGDTLWVRETWRPCQPSEGKGSSIQYRAGGEYERKTDFPDVFRTKGSDRPDKWRPSIHMPRWASRILLTVTDVRVERIQDISEQDCCDEGCGSPITRDCKRPKFMALWDTIYGKQKPDKPDLSWAANPWVWAITFEVTL